MSFNLVPLRWIWHFTSTTNTSELGGAVSVTNTMPTDYLSQGASFTTRFFKESTQLFRRSKHGMMYINLGRNSCQEDIRCLSYHALCGLTIVIGDIDILLMQPSSNDVQWNTLYLHGVGGESMAE
jgi:hypothetical protein